MTRDQSLQPTTKAPAVSTEAKDGVQNYAHRVLELGLLYKDLLDMCKLPSRARALPLLKLIMLLFKVNSNLSKYALEVMRLLVHQLCSLSEQAAHEEFYGLFVNTEGSPAGHVACDDRMEWQVKLVKDHIKHMASNKSEKNISNAPVHCLESKASHPTMTAPHKCWSGRRNTRWLQHARMNWPWSLICISYVLSSFTRDGVTVHSKTLVAPC